MKNLIIILFALVLFASCEKENISINKNYVKSDTVNIESYDKIIKDHAANTKE